MAPGEAIFATGSCNYQGANFFLKKTTDFQVDAQLGLAVTLNAGEAVMRNGWAEKHSTLKHILLFMPFFSNLKFTCSCFKKKSS